MTLGHDKMTLRRYPHSILPMITQTQNAPRPPYDYQVSRYEFAHPLPVHPGTQTTKPRDDPVLQLVRQKDNLAADLKSMQLRMQNQMSMNVNCIIYKTVFLYLFFS